MENATVVLGMGITPEIVRRQRARVKRQENPERVAKPKRNLLLAKAAPSVQTANVLDIQRINVGASITIASARAKARASLEKWLAWAKKMKMLKKY